VKRLVQALATQIRDRVRNQVANLQGDAFEFRTVFHGPPHDLMHGVLQLLKEQGGIEVTVQSGKQFTLPVLFQMDRLPPGQHNPPTGTSGHCDPDHLLAVRNSQSPSFVALLSPGGRQVSLSLSSATDEFGLAAASNSATATITDWLGDPFIQKLLGDALDRHSWQSPEQRHDAHRLVEESAKAADEADRHSVDRRGAWGVLSRTWSISDPSIPFGTSLSLACGFPPMEDGSIDADQQVEVLRDLASDMEDKGFKAGFEYIRTDAEPIDLPALDAVQDHLVLKCDRLTTFPRAPQYFYGPFQGDEVGDPPPWWSYLTVEAWKRLLEDTSVRSRGAIKVECANSIIPVARGINAVVSAGVELKVSLPECSNARVEVDITREVGGAANRRAWELMLPDDGRLTDDDIPAHASLLRYSAEAIGYKKGTLRVVSLDAWKPGIFVYSRTASKVAPPKASRDKKATTSYETSLTLNGQGRHYLDVFVGAGISVGDTARGSDEDGALTEEKVSPIARVSETAYGFEVDAAADCHYDIAIQRGAELPATVRIYLSCEETTPDHCGSEFERLIRINRHRGIGRATTDVHVNRHFRSTDLESWMLDQNQVAHSYYPLVLAADYASDWRIRDWASQGDTILSKAVFLHDPRPQPSAFQPPERFTSARKELAERIRGQDGNGLVEAAKFGEWLASDTGFAETVEAYVRSYLEWLDADPNVAAWIDLSLLTEREADGATLVPEPYAVLVSPLHPIRLAWHCLAQRALFQSARKLPCPAASILDPDAIPDSIILPLITATGDIKGRPFFAVECSSDYWSVLWNAERLDRIPRLANTAPLDSELGLLVGGVSSGFSVSQVNRALDDVSDMLVAKPVLNIYVTSAAGHNNACNEGLVSWCRTMFGASDEPVTQLKSIGRRLVQILDGRDELARPDDSEISNLAEDTSNSVRWYGASDNGIRPDLGIIAQLETSSAGWDNAKFGSPLGFGGLIRHRVRQQLKAGSGAFLSETRTGSATPPSGDGLADKASAAIVRLENLGPSRIAYTFAPSVNAIRRVLTEAEADYAAVSSSAIDPACFLGGWLEGTYLWDYDLPSYSSRAGDSNGYYLLSKIKDLDRETLGAVLSRLPGCSEIDGPKLDEAIQEVARRGIPTVRGLSSGHSGASGDLGLFVASRVLQDEFRASRLAAPSLLPSLVETELETRLVLVIPIDPFRGYLDDLSHAAGKTSNQRPDLIVVGVRLSDSRVALKLTPIEVKYRSAKEPMAIAACQEALAQATSLSELFGELKARSNDPDLLMWKLAFQHLLTSMIGFGFRVYSQQLALGMHGAKWSTFHARVMEAILSSEMDLEVDMRGRLIVIDGSTLSGPRDSDGDGFKETIVLGHRDAASVVMDETPGVYAAIRSALGEWEMLPLGRLDVGQTATPSPTCSPEPEGTETASGVELSAPEDAGQAPTEPSQPVPLPEDEGNLPADDMPRSAIPAPADGVNLPTEASGGVDVLIGEAVDGFRPESRRVNLSDTRLNQLNIGVVGDLGTGKTQLLKSLVFQIAKSRADNQGIAPRILIFDYKKDYSSEDFVNAVGAKVVKPQNLPLNLFDVAGAGQSMAPWLDRFKFFSDVLDKIYSGIGPVQRQQLKRAVREAYESCEAMGRQPTIYDVHSNYQALLGNKSDTPLSIIDDLVDMGIFSREPIDGDGFDKFLDGIVIISLDALGQDDQSKNMLVAIMLNMFYEHMLRIPKRPYVGTNPQLRTIDSFLLVDEADNIMRYEFDVLRKVLLQGREFGVGVILASQYLKHFKAGATDYREPLLTWFIHKVPNVTPQELGALGLSGDMSPIAERVKSLAVHECLCKTLGVPGEIVKGTPFYSLLKRCS
jgi:DNA phosphorothioation-dependent restriction protein DptH